MGQAGPAGSMCGYPVLAAVAVSLSLLLMPLPGFADLPTLFHASVHAAAFLESASFAASFFESSAFAAFCEPASFTAFCESASFAAALFHAPAFLTASFAASFFESSAFLTASFAATFFESSAFPASLFESASFAAALFHTPAFPAAFLESASFAAALFHAPALAASFPAIVAVLTVALPATTPTSGAGLCGALRDLRGAAGGIDRLRLHSHRDDEGRRCDRASSQCFFEHEYHSVDSVTVAGEHPDTRSANRSIEPWNQTLISTLEVTKGPVTQECANNRFSQQKRRSMRVIAGAFSRSRHSLYVGRSRPSTSLRRIGCDRTSPAAARLRHLTVRYGGSLTETARVLEVAVTEVKEAGWGVS
ncbi:hypothetical protein ACQPZZ_12905 [Microbispora sp. CA-135349]|uniref:hypothetical protein n=1 Tax=Microbispora sp. CA-135349 TaxID=3239953 RepID=UPI003D8C2FDA